MDLLDWARAVFALLATLALIGAVAYGARRFGMLQNVIGAKSEKRLRVCDSLMLDPRRRLIVVRFDDREHLILLSPSGDRVVTDVAAREVAPAGEKGETPT